jgi:alkanesulfonate monooxygenase SsuD/methylene tetrahydromethanopterin reductase-like flavin-dependent oxidoreductase (luciferase family)
VLHGLWTNDTFSYSGQHYTITDARLVPKPVQQPEPPLWIGATSVPGVRRAGRRGANLLGLTNPKLQTEYEQARAEAGLDPATAKFQQLFWTHVGATDDDAWDEAVAHFHHLLTVYAGWIDAAEDPGNSVRNSTVPPVHELRTSRPTLFKPVFGSPSTVVTDLREAMGRVRTTHLGLGLVPGMDPAVTRRSMERFAREVAPALDA